MLKLSKKMYYAVEAVLYIAYNTKTVPIASRDIAERQGLPPRYLEQIMQKLVRAGILRGVRGPRGGYVLAKERRRISIADICSVIRDEDELPVEELQKTILGHGVLLPICHELSQRLSEELAQIDVAQLCQKATSKHIRREHDAPMDFTI